jgi:hypothetical protein
MCPALEDGGIILGWVTAGTLLSIANDGISGLLLIVGCYRQMGTDGSNTSVPP